MSQGWYFYKTYLEMKISLWSSGSVSHSVGDFGPLPEEFLGVSLGIISNSWCQALGGTNTSRSQKLRAPAGSGLIKKHQECYDIINF